MKTTAREWTARLAELLRRERAAMAEFLEALAAFDRERLWEPLGYTSLFWFLHRELGLSKGPAFYRKTAAELLQKYPAVIAPLRDGRLCLTSIVELSKVITPENSAEVMPRFFQLSTREAKEVAAALAPLPAPPLRDMVTVVRSSTVEPTGSRVPPSLNPPSEVNGSLAAGDGIEAPRGGSAENLPHANCGVPDVSCAPEVRPQPIAFEVEPVSANLARLHITVSKRLLEKIEAARAALSHSHPGAARDEILEAGLDLLLERAAKRKGLVERPRATARPTTTGAIPAAVKREVWKRAGGKCEWPMEGGGVCGSTVRLEFDHVVPRALGGESTATNLRLTCRCHNQLAARQVFGDEWMAQFARGRRASDEPPKS